MAPLRTLALTAVSTVALAGAERVAGQAREEPSADWAQNLSDLKADPAIRFGTLPNGMRYALRRNATPPGQVSLRLRVDAGSLMEKDNQRGLAHFMEHMAFNGTTHLPEDQLVQILQRNGLAFGTDTNASTSFDQTIYQLDVPAASGDRLDTALHIMREQMSEALMNPKDIDDERGVISGEQRLRDSPALRAEIARLKLIAPRIGSRIPIGDMEVIRTAPRERFVDFYDTYYRPSRVTLVAVGDFDVDAMEARIKRLFADWAAKSRDQPDPAPPTELSRGVDTTVHVEPGSRSSVELIWTRPPDLRPDSEAKQRDKAMRFVGLSVLNERLTELANGDHPPFISARASADDLFRMLDVTSVRAEFLPGRLREAMIAIEREQRRLTRYGITPFELRRVVDGGRNFMRQSVLGASTELTPALASRMVSEVNDRTVSMAWADRLALFEREVKGLTPATVERAITAAFTGAGPLAFVITPTPVPGGEAAVTRELAAARKVSVTAPPHQVADMWPYTAFGAPGTVTGRREIPELGAAVVTFANGTFLTVKPTHFTDKEVQISVTAGLGQLGMARDRMDPLYGAKTYMIKGGLGKLTDDQIGYVLAGRSVGAEGSVEQDRFKWKGETQTSDLPLEMQLLAAYVTDPGLRPAPLERDKATLADQIASFRANPSMAWQMDAKDLLTSGDRREAIPSAAEMQHLSMTTAAPLYRRAIGAGPISVIVVGDTTVDQAIAATAATFGALPPRGPATTPPASADVRRFPAGGGPVVQLHHTGPADQAVAFVGWPAPDRVKDNTKLVRTQVLARVFNLRVLAEIRERQALAYSPGVTQDSSYVYPGYGYMGVIAVVKPDKVPALFTAVDKLAADLRDKPVTQDELDRVQRPLVEQLRNLMASNSFWVDSLRDVDTRPERVGQITHAIAITEAVTIADIQALARVYLKPELAWRGSVTPSTADLGK